MGRIPWKTESSDKQLPQLRTASSQHSTCKDVSGISQLTPKFFFPSHEALIHSSQFKFCGWTLYGSLQAWSTVAAVSIHHLWRFGPKMVLQGLFNKTSGREQRAQITLCSCLWLVTETASCCCLCCVCQRQRGLISNCTVLLLKTKITFTCFGLNFPSKQRLWAVKRLSCIHEGEKGMFV